MENTKIIVNRKRPEKITVSFSLAEKERVIEYANQERLPMGTLIRNKFLSIIDEREVEKNEC